MQFEANFAAGKNKFLNADFKIWQRGTSFTGFSSGAFFADRFSCNFNGSGATRTVSQQTFTPATAPVAGYEGQYFLRYAQSVAGTGGGYNQLKTWIEDVRSVTPGTTYTLSFWAKAAAAKNVDVILGQSFGSGGSGDVETTIQAAQALTTSWVRYSYTFTVPSISGKTVGANSYAFVYLGLPNNDTFTIDTWGWQLEQANTATAFQTATGTIQGELAACQRYYFRNGGLASYMALGGGTAESTTRVEIQVAAPVTMRVLPTSVDFSTIAVQPFGTGTITAVTSAALGTVKGLNPLNVELNVASGLTQGVWYRGLTNNSTSGYLGFSAEL
jgi:hypothetical protein